MRWDGQEWHDVGGGMDGLCQFSCQVHHLEVFNGALYAVGQFLWAGGVPVSGIAKWDGNQWCGLGLWFDDVIVSKLGVYDGELYLNARNIEGQPVSYFAKWTGGSYVDSCGVVSSLPEQPTTAQPLRLYPNPSTNSTRVEAHNATEVTLWSVTGQRLGSGTRVSADVFEIDVHPHPAGVYRVQVKSKNHVRSALLLKY